MDTVFAIEQILDHGKKSSTYKLAVLRAIVDYTIEHPGRVPTNGFHFIPTIELALRVLAYYWKPALDDVPQGSSGNERIPSAIRSFATDGSASPGLTLNHRDAGGFLVERLKQQDELEPQLVGLLLEVRDTLLRQPLRYIHDGPQKVFSLITEGAKLSMADDYHQHRKAAPGKREMRADSWLGLQNNERTCLVLSARAYEEITALRFWLRDAILMRWATECERFAQGTVPLSVLALETPARDAALMGVLKEIYSSAGAATCFYTGDSLGSHWDLDHVLPFSRFPVNMFWNLVPASAEANRGKRGKFDQLPPLTADFHEMYLDLGEAVIGSHEKPIMRDLAATYRSHFQLKELPAATPARHAASMWSLLESSWKRLEDAGISVWTPPHSSSHSL